MQRARRGRRAGGAQRDGERQRKDLDAETQMPI
jgi:hypothetical protein